MFVPLTISAVFIIVAYLLGSIPTGYWLSKSLKGIDIREHGSGSTGATNVFRTVGKAEGIAVFIIDILKGVAAVALAKWVLPIVAADLVPLDWKFWLITLAAFAAVIGHSKSIWINFTGGKSVATSLGVLLVMSPLVALGTIGACVLVLVIFRIVSLASITGMITVNILMIVLAQPLPYILFAGVAGVYVIWRHRSNIQRLVAGKEPKLGEKLST